MIVGWSICLGYVSYIYGLYNIISQLLISICCLCHFYALVESIVIIVVIIVYWAPVYFIASFFYVQFECLRHFSLFKYE